MSESGPHKHAVETTGLLPWVLAPFRDRVLLGGSLWILLAGVGLRLLLMYHATPLWTVSDSHDYHDFARSLMEGRGFCQVYQGERAAFRGMTFYAYRMPGYPALLAIVYTLFGWHAWAGMMLNLLADIVTALAIAVIGYHLYGRSAALWAQGLWAAHVFWTSSLLAESVFTALFLTAVLLLVAGSPLRSAGGALAYGAVTCAATFVRPIGLCTYLPLGLKMLCQPLRLGRKVLLLALAALPTLCAVTLWAARNQRVLGRPVLFATQQGRVMAQDYGIVFERVYHEYRSKGCNEADIDRVLKRMVRDKIRAQPTLALRMYRDHALQLFRLRPRRDHNFMHLKFQFGQPGQPRWLLPLVKALYYQYYVTYLLAAAGVLVLLWRRGPVFDLLASLGSYVVLHAAVARSSIRYAAPLYPLLGLLAGFMLSWVIGLCVRLAPARRAAAGSTP